MKSESLSVLVIAHRLSTVRNANQICVVNEGAVVESGTHDELVLNENGPYSQLVSKQMNFK